VQKWQNYTAFRHDSVADWRYQQEGNRKPISIRDTKNFGQGVINPVKIFLMFSLITCKIWLLFLILCAHMWEVPKFDGRCWPLENNFSATCYYAKFGHCRSNYRSVIIFTEIRQKIWSIASRLSRSLASIGFHDLLLVIP